MARVIDPAGGSWYVEQLTDDLAEPAWAWFQEIERGRRHGRGPRLRAGRATGSPRPGAAPRRDIARRREPITGVSEFPNLAEQPVDRERRARRRPAADCRACATPRRSRRCATAPTRTGRRAAPPAVFLATLGPVAAHTARAAFAANLFQAGGHRDRRRPGTATRPTIAAAFAASGAARRLPVLAATRLYAEQAAAVAARAAARPGRHGSGWPASRATDGRTTGRVDGSSSRGCDAVARPRAPTLRAGSELATG